jgi:hypothetical protein
MQAAYHGTTDGSQAATASTAEGMTEEIIQKVDSIAH